MSKYQKKSYTLQCKICGREFESNYPKAAYCSKECRKAGQRETQKKYEEAHPERHPDRGSRVCLMCHEPLRPGTRGRYCSTCKAIINRPKPKKRERVLDDIDKVVVAAAAAHMSYGNYVSKGYCRKMRIKRELMGL